MIDLIINRRARKYQRDDSLMDRICDAAAGRCRIWTTSSLAELDQVASELAQSNSHLVVFCGGDGSLMAGVTALKRHFDELPPLAPIPGGTVCTVGRNWGISGDPARCLQRLLERPRRLVARPTLAVQDDTELRIGFIFGSGLVARFFQLYYERGAPGYSGSAKMVGRIFVESFVGGSLARRVLEPLPCTLAVDGHELPPRAWSLICSSVVANLGLHMLVTHRAAEQPQRPHLVATPLAPQRLGPRLPLVLAGRPLGGSDSFDDLTSNFSLQFPDEGPYVLDGELLTTKRVEVCAGPVIEVAQPT